MPLDAISLAYVFAAALVGLTATLAVAIARGRDTAGRVKDLEAHQHALELRVVASEGNVAALMGAIADLKVAIEKLGVKLDTMRDAV